MLMRQTKEIIKILILRVHELRRYEVTNEAAVTSGESVQYTTDSKVDSVQECFS